MNTIAATATSTGLTVTAVLDAGRYPAGAEVTGAQMKDLEDRVIARHGFHGDWNYTILPVPRPAPDPGRRRPRAAAPPGRGPGRPGPARATGLPPGAAAALAAVLAMTRLRAAAAARTASGPPRRQRPRQKITFAGHVLAASSIIGYLPPAHLAALFGCDRSTIGHELPRTRQLLAATAPPSRPAPAPWPPARTCATTPPATASPSPPRQRTPPAATLATPGTPQTHLKKGRAPCGLKGPRTPPCCRSGRAGGRVGLRRGRHRPR